MVTPPTDETARTGLAELVELFSQDEEVLGALEGALIAKPPARGQPHQVRSITFADQAEEFFRDLIWDAVFARIPDWAPVAFSPIYKPDETELEWQALPSAPAVALATTRLDNLAGEAPFDPSDDDFKKRLIYWVCSLKIDDDDRRVTFLRRFSQTAELSRGRHAFVAKSGTFRRVTDNIFLFDEKVDCFVFDDLVYVINKYEYRRVFEQMDAVRREAKKAANALRKKVPIQNYDAFEKACSSQASMADKIIAIRGSDYFNTLSIPLLKPVIDEFSLQADVPIVMSSSGTEELVFLSPPGQRFAILKLVGDDYLRSTMTKHLYETNSKKQRQGST